MTDVLQFYIFSHHTVGFFNFPTKWFTVGRSKFDNEKDGKQLKKIALSHINKISHKLSLLLLPIALRPFEFGLGLPKLSLTYTKYIFQT